MSAAIGRYDYRPSHPKPCHELLVHNLQDSAFVRGAPESRNDGLRLVEQP